MTQTTLAILAGGEGSRMGRPKGELRLGDGRPIVEFLLDRLAWRGPTLLVTAPGREHPPGWQRFDAEAVDPVAGLGPLRGVLTALQNAPTSLVALTTVDMPLLDPELLIWLIEELRTRADAIGLMARRGEQVEPFPCACRISAAPLIEAKVNARELSVQALSREAAIAVADVPAQWDRDDVWTNLNHPHDLADFLTRLSRSSRAGP
jgi:molybdopterin-guanine dinucleotide biosynthesis protein A